VVKADQVKVITYWAKSKSRSGKQEHLNKGQK